MTAEKTEIRKYYNHEKATKDLREYDADISIELMRQPGLFAYYSALLVQADAQVDRLESSVDILSAKLDSVIRSEAAKTSTKLTETQVKSRIAMDSRMMDLQRLLRDARSEAGYLKGTCTALVQRKDTLMQLAYLMRKELDNAGGGLTVMQQSMRENHAKRLTRLDQMAADFDNIA